MEQMKKIPFICFILLFACQDNRKEKLTQFALIDKLSIFDIPLKEPVQGDWLFSYKEPGQTFDEYKKINPVMPNKQQNCIYLQPIGHFTDWQNKVVTFTREYIEDFFGLKTILLPCISDIIIPEHAQRDVYGNIQLHTRYILDSILLPNIPANAIVCMAITEKDLYPEASWNFVFGQAYTKERVGVSSIFHYGEKTKDSLDYNLCLERIIKTATHEIGHMFSIEHCTHAECLMNGSNGLTESDSRPNILCSECLKKLYWNMEFDNIDRFKKLQAFYAKHHLYRDLAIASNAIKQLQK